MDKFNAAPVFTRSQLQAALSISGLKPVQDAPLAVIPARKKSAAFSVEDQQVLRKAGWLEPGETLQISNPARFCLEALCNPSVRVSLLLGTPQTIGTTYAYSANGFSKESFSIAQTKQE